MSGTVYASDVPDQVRQSVIEELMDQELQWNLLTEQTEPTDAQTDTVSKKDAEQSNSQLTLGEGKVQYVIWIDDIPNDYNGHLVASGDVLRDSGYVFAVESNNRSKGIVFAEQKSDSDRVEITQMSTDEAFAEEMRTVRKSVGDHPESKLIYDGANQVVALVFTEDEVEQVVLLKDSMLNEMKQFEQLPFAEFIDQISHVQQERKKLASQFDEPVFGGSSASTGDIDQYHFSPLAVTFFIGIVLVMAVLLFLICRKLIRRKMK